MTEAEEPAAPLSDTTLCVRYTGNSHFRILTRLDISGIATEGALDQLVWTPGSELSYELFEEYAGSAERAFEVLEAHAHEFEVVGPGSEDFE